MNAMGIFLLTLRNYNKSLDILDFYLLPHGYRTIILHLVAHLAK